MLCVILELKALIVYKWSIVLDTLRWGVFLGYQSICSSVSAADSWVCRDDGNGSFQAPFAFCVPTSTEEHSPEVKTVRTRWIKRGPWTARWNAPVWVTGWRGKIRTMFFCCRPCACTLPQTGTTSNVGLQECYKFIWKEEIQNPSSFWKNVCQLTLNWDFPLHSIYLRMHNEESFLWGKLRNALREKASS